MIKLTRLCIPIIGILFSLGIYAQVNVDVNLNIKHSVDGVSDFGRERHMTLHSAAGERDWQGHEDMLDYLMNDLDVYFGRDNGSAGWKNSNVAEDPEKANWPDVNYLKSYGNDLKRWYESDDFISRHQYEARSGQMIMGMVPHPNYPTLDWNPKGPGRFRKGLSDEWQIFDVKASAFLMAHYLDNHFSKNDDEIGEPLPAYWECINEPDMEMFMWHKMFVTKPEFLWEYHNESARLIKELLGDAAPKIGGMTWGQHDLALQDLLQRQGRQFYIDNGDEIIDEACNSLTWDHRKEKWWQWDGLFQGFIDNCGENMDFYSIHIYDWPQVDTSKTTIRAGGHTEAMLDLLEWYDMHKFGKKKEIVVSEFGAVGPGTSDLPLKKRDWWNLMPFNQMMMQFLERPSHLTLTMPFAPVKAQWGDQFNADGSLLERYSVTMMDPVGDYREDSPGARYDHKDWEWSNIILFYELWKDVKGTRIDTKSSDRDIQVDAYVDGSHVYLILNNLEDEAATINLNYFDDYANDVESVRMVHQYFDADQDIPVNKEAVFAAAPGSVLLGASATIILDYEFENAVTIDQESKEVKFIGEPVTSATTFLGAQQCHVSVSGRAKFTTEINNVVVPSVGEATLRIGLNTFAVDNIEIVVNGNVVTGEYDHEDWRGRERIRSGSGWYGVFEQDIPLEYLQEDNTIEVTNHRHNSEYSTFILQVWDFTKAPKRTQKGDTIHVDDIALSGPASIMQGQTGALNVGFTPSNASDKRITWSSSNPSVATVDEFGVVTAIASSGTTTITATSVNNNTASATYTITAIPYEATPVTGIEITNGTSIEVEYYVTTPLTISITPEDATIQDVLWSSDNPDAVAVDSLTGKITGIQVNGSATITATLIDTESGDAIFTDDIDVYVTIVGPERVFCRELPSQVRPFISDSVLIPVKTMGQRDVEIEIYQDATLIGSGATSFEHYGDTNIYVVYTLSGVPALGTNYSIDVTLVNSGVEVDACSQELEVIDHYRADTIALIPGIRTVQVGETIQLEAEVLPSNTFNKEVSWSSSNSSIATIDASTGVVTGVAEGYSIITATSSDGGFTASDTVWAQDDPVHIYIDSIYIPEKLTIYPGLSEDMSYSFYPQWATDTNVTWSSDQPSVAAIDANGVITTTAGITGEVTITATSEYNDEVFATCAVSVTPTIIIEAEEFSTTGGAYDGFTTYVTGEGIGGINNNQVGDWADYEVEFPVTGDYSIKYFIGAPATNTDIAVNIYLDGVLHSTTTLSSTGGWDTFGEFDASTTISVTGGTHTIRIESAGGSNWQWNCDRIELTNEGATPVTGIDVDPETILVGVTQERLLTETIYPAGATIKTVTWSSTNTAVVTVDDGLITGQSVGSAFVIATTNDGGFKDTCTVTVQLDPVEVPVESISVSPTTSELGIGSTLQLTENVLPEDADDKTVSWSSNNTGIATVDVDGLVTGVAEGTAIITVISNDDNSITATCTVNVSNIIPPSIAFDDENKYTTTVYVSGETIEVVCNFHAGTGNTVTDNFDGIEFRLREMESDWINVVNDYIANDASVIGSESGTATASISLTGVTPTAELEDDNFYFLWMRFTSSNGSSYNVGVNPITIVAPDPIPVESVSVSPVTGSVVVGSTTSLSETVLPIDATDKSVSWNSGDTGIATVSSDGTVTGVSKGEVTITVTTNDGAKTANATISVVTDAIDVTGVSINPGSVTIAVDGTASLSAAIEPENATNQDVSWSSSDTNIVKIDETGKVTGVALGNATVTVTTDDGGYTANVSVSVIEDFIEVTGIAVSPSSKTIKEGETVNLATTIAPANASNQSVTWSSSNNSVATVNSDGVVTAVAEGVANIIARTVDGGYETISVITVEKGLDVNDITLDNISVYPNPARNTITISGIGQGEYIITVFNLQGAELMIKEINTTSGNTISINSLPNGIYILNIYNESINENIRFVKNE